MPEPQAVGRVTGSDSHAFVVYRFQCFYYCFAKTGESIGFFNPNYNVFRYCYCHGFIGNSYATNSFKGRGDEIIIHTYLTTFEVSIV